MIQAKTLDWRQTEKSELYIKNDEAFCFTYGDGLADVDVNALIEFHRSHGAKRRSRRSVHREGSAL